MLLAETDDLLNVNHQGERVQVELAVLCRFHVQSYAFGRSGCKVKSIRYILVCILGSCLSVN